MISAQLSKRFFISSRYADPDKLWGCFCSTVARNRVASITSVALPDIPELRGNLQAYRKAWQEAGHAGNGNVFLRVPVYAGVTEQGALEEPHDSIRPLRVCLDTLSQV